MNSGPHRPFFLGTGAGAPIPGNAPAIGLVSYLEFKLFKKDLLSLRPVDFLNDRKGERTGFATTYGSWTVGLTHRFSDLISVRPELRYAYAFSARPYDNGMRSGQLMFAMDAIVHF